MKGDYFLSCDWGTSSFRISLVERGSGQTITEWRDSDGIKQSYNRWESGRDTGNRRIFLLKLLNEKIGRLAESSGQNTENIPVLLSGMAGSSLGIEELPYGSLPLSLRNPDLIVRKLAGSDALSNPVYLVSGLRNVLDVMRGEEVQLLGLARRHELQQKSVLCLLPGTHSKHLKIERGELVDFATYMTGELFELISTGSILRDALQDNVSDRDERRRRFIQGVEDAAGGALFHRLFTLRADLLLNGEKRSRDRDYLSGLLIGTELLSLSELPPKPLILSASGELQELYSTALDKFGIDHVTDEDPAGLTLEGHLVLIELLEKTGRH